MLPRDCNWCERPSDNDNNSDSFSPSFRDEVIGFAAELLKFLYIAFVIDVAYRGVLSMVQVHKSCFGEGWLFDCWKYSRTCLDISGGRSCLVYSDGRVYTLTVPRTGLVGLDVACWVDHLFNISIGSSSTFSAQILTVLLTVLLLSFSVLSRWVSGLFNIHCLSCLSGLSPGCYLHQSFWHGNRSLQRQYRSHRLSYSWSSDIWSTQARRRVLLCCFASFKGLVDENHFLRSRNQKLTGWPTWSALSFSVYRQRAQIEIRARSRASIHG